MVSRLWIREAPEEKGWSGFPDQCRDTLVDRAKGLLPARVLHSLALVRGPLQHGGHLQQGAVVPELGQHLEQQHDGAVHVPGEAAWPVDLVHRDPPDALWDAQGGRVRKAAATGAAMELRGDSGQSRATWTHINVPRRMGGWPLPLLPTINGKKR